MRKQLTKEAYKRILVYLEYARPAELDSTVDIEIDEEITLLQQAIKAIIQ